MALWAIAWEVVNTHFSPEALAGLSGLSPRDGREESARISAETALPNTESEDWRYSPIGDLAIDRLRPADKPSGTPEGNAADPVEGAAATVSIVDGYVVDISVDSGWAAKGLDISVDSSATITTDDQEQTAFDHWHRAFSPGPVVIKVPAGLAVGGPVVIDNHHGSAGTVGFSHVVVEGGENSELQIIERQSSTDDVALSVPVVELTVGPAARLGYLTVQENGRAFWSIGRHRSSVGAQATLTTGIGSFGSHYARVRSDSRLIGRGSTANLVAAYYGDGDQVHDFRTFQHHEARDTRSDLLFKGAQDDRSGSIYTGLIHIHPGGAGSNAFQTNRNIKLSEDAWAWSVPNLEIENNEVHCSHASTVSPVDDDQRFYLGARGVPPGPADRLIVAGFFDEVIKRMPVAAIRPQLSNLVAAKLDGRET